MIQMFKLLLLAFLFAFLSARTVLGQEDDSFHILAVAWSHDGKKIAAVGVQPQSAQGYIRVLNLATSQITYQEEPASSGFTSVAWSPDDSSLAIGSFDTSIWIIDLKTGAHVASLQGHSAPVSAVDWSSDATKLVTSGSWDQLIILWDMTTYQPLAKLETSGFVNNIAFSPDNQKIAVGTEQGLYVFPTDLQNIIGRNQDDYIYIHARSGAIVWSPNGHQLAFGTKTIRHLNGNRPDAHVFLINADSRSTTMDISFPWGSVSGLAWSPDNSLLAAYGADDVVKIFSPEDGSLLDSFNGSGVSKYSIGNLDFSRYGGQLAFGVSVQPIQQARSADGKENTILENSGVTVVVPTPSVQRLTSIANACNAPSTVKRAIASNAQTSQFDSFIIQVEALPANTIPSACSADLVAVANALQSK